MLIALYVILAILLWDLNRPRGYSTQVIIDKIKLIGFVMVAIILVIILTT